MEKTLTKIRALPFFTVFSRQMTKSKSNLLKLIAAATMLIDHTGFLYFPQDRIFRIIGRIAFPIFAYQIATGFKFTSNVVAYIKRLFIFALISQIPFYLMTEDPYELNVIFTFFFAAVALYFLKKRQYPLILIPLIISYFVPMDYGIYGVGAVLIFYLFFKHPVFQFLGFYIATTIASYFMGWHIQLYSIAGVALILIIKAIPMDFDLHLNKYFFYWFYPVHMLLLVLIGKIF